MFVVHSEERLDYERGEREKAMQRVQEELETLRQRVNKGQLKAPEKIGAAASECSLATTDSATTLGNCKRVSSTILNMQKT